MDLGAYIKIDELEVIAKANGIEIPRPRGYRLMKDEKPITDDDFERLFSMCEVDAVYSLCMYDPFWKLPRNGSVYSIGTNKLDYYMKYGPDEYGCLAALGARWDRIHGKKRRILKYEIKKTKRKALEQFSVWNRYAGRDDVLYIHARIGGSNWIYYDGKKQVLEQTWFLDRVDDWRDNTYCDIYSKIDPSLTMEE